MIDLPNIEGMLLDINGQTKAREPEPTVKQDHQQAVELENTETSAPTSNQMRAAETIPQQSSSAKLEPKENDTTPTEQNHEPQIPQEQGPSSDWVSFLQCVEQYGFRMKHKDRKSYPIDIDVINTFKHCHIGRASVENLISAALRAFINANKEQLRQYYQEEKNLL